MPDGRGFVNVSGVSTKLSEIDNGRKMTPMQYTGLKDKNGVEIYEGDVLRLLMVSKGEMSVYWESCEVFWRAGRWNAGYPEGQGKDLWHWTDMDSNTYECVIIGNIHENPELLNG